MPGTKNILWPQKAVFGLFQVTFWDSDLPKSDNKFYQKKYFCQKLAQANTLDPNFGQLGKFSVSFTI